jgi:glycogen debranching enzyme
VRDQPAPAFEAEASGLGATPVPGGVRFSAWSRHATRLSVCLFDPRTGRETRRVPMERDGDIHTVLVPGLAPGARYGLRAHGPWEPALGHWFDPTKLLVDPYALALDRPFRFDPRLARHGHDTAGLVPKAIVTALPPPVPPAPPRFRPGGLIYEVAVRAFTMRHPAVPEHQRGTIAALGHPAILDHLRRLHVTAVELMPITAWIDERHLPPLGLANAWGYNPVVYLAPDPRICPGGLAELRATVETLHDAGIGVLLDVVFNHTGESDAHGPTLSLRGLDNAAYYRHDDEDRLINDTGCGNTLACEHPAVRRLVLDAMRHFVRQAGIDGFRFDLAPILGRLPQGFTPDAPLLTEIRTDPVLADRVLIAEPWDIGPGGYQLGRFPAPFLEWNDRYRITVRRFWKGARYELGPLATALAGSSEIFHRTPDSLATRSVNFVAAHDGMTLADLVAYARKHNEANGEANRDGEHDDHSWNHGHEGLTDAAAIRAARDADIRALLGTLFASRGTIMLTAGDEFGRSQRGNNNAYSQDNEITWLDWENRDRALEHNFAALSALRARLPLLSDPRFLTGSGVPPDVAWLAPAGHPMTPAEWEDEHADALAMVLGSETKRVAVLVNRSRHAVAFHLPKRPGFAWPRGTSAPARSVRILEDHPTGRRAPT